MTEYKSWRELANCLDYPTYYFFPISKVDEPRALAICADCLVKQECLDYALTLGEQHGVWGGMTESERRRLKDSYKPVGTKLKSSKKTPR